MGQPAQLPLPIAYGKANAVRNSGGFLVNLEAEAVPDGADARSPVTLRGSPGLKTFCNGVQARIGRAQHRLATIGNALLVQGRDRRGNGRDFIVSRPSDAKLDPHALFVQWKQHPRIKGLLDGGKVLRYGAKAVPEGGYFSQPKL